MFLVPNHTGNFVFIFVSLVFPARILLWIKKTITVYEMELKTYVVVIHSMELTFNFLHGFCFSFPLNQ